MTLRGYELSLIEYSGNREFEILKAGNSVEAMTILEDNTSMPFDIVFLDINLPISQELNLINGEDLGLKIKKKYRAKIIVISSIIDQERIYGILKNLKPDGFITKCETIPEILIDAIDYTLRDEKYYSKDIKKYYRINDIKNEHLDSFDLKILHLISVGEKMKNLPEYVPLSLPSIERRKKKIKTYFGINSTSDRELISKAKEKGFV